jgi:hypothetical protein
MIWRSCSRRATVTGATRTPFYRFYHQSFKVYGLQDSTRAIVRTLQSLAPDRPLNPWFLEIVGSGTGKEFRPEDNDAPPRPLPSGYAALLELFGLR